MAPIPGTVVLFVGGDPGLAARLSSFPKGVSGAARLVVPIGLLGESYDGRARGKPADPWPVPADQLMCIQNVARAAKSSGRTVRIVDVNHPETDRELVERFVGPQDVLPILLRSDSARLVGVESFRPDLLRRFLAVP